MGVTFDVSQEYVKNEDLKKEDVEVLKEWVQKQPHLPEMSEAQIILFFQSCYFKIEATKTTIESFFTLKANCPDFFANRDPNLARTKLSMNCGCFAKLPDVTPEKYNVLLFTFMDSDPSMFYFDDQVKLFDMCMRLWLKEEGSSQGLLIVLDFKDLTFTHLARLSIFSVRDILMYLQEALPVRLKGLHFVNGGSVIDKLMLMIKPFLKKELAEILHIHKDVSESLIKFVPQKYLPKDYGGDADSLKTFHEAMKKKLLDNAEYFIEDEKQLADETKRENRKNSFNLDYGTEGSFKKLEID